jgi:hypothetical protein
MESPSIQKLLIPLYPPLKKGGFLFPSLYQSLPAPPSVGTACLPVGRGPVERGGWGKG